MSDYRKPTFQDLLDPFQEDFNAFMLGELLGSGESRAVYAAPFDKRWVYKIERSKPGSYDFHNVAEYRLWAELEDYPEARAWLAPIRCISNAGRILMMARTKPLPDEKPLKGLKIPDFLGDTHYGNFGWLKGRIVCHDYAFNRTAQNAAKRFKLVRNERVAA